MNTQASRMVRIMSLNLLLLAIGITGFSQARSAVSAKQAERLKSELQQKLDELHVAGKFPGATAGFALADGRTFGLAVGLSNVEAGTPMKPSDLMLQGSVGKTYVAAVAMQLVGEKRLRLDDKIERYLGSEKWFARLPNAREITVRMLMNHTSGLVRYEFKEQFTKDLTANPDKRWRPEELVAYILDSAPPFAAGHGWEYSDTNYIVLGMIIERVTKSRYYEQVTQRVLRPLRLARTLPSDSRMIPGLIQGYAGANNPFGGTDAMIVGGRFAINPQFEWCGGGMASTTEDLARWAKALYEGRAFDRSLLGEMLDGVPAKLGPEAKYGLGVIIRPTALGISYGHSGFFPGYITEMIYFPEHKFAVAVQVNTSVPRATGKPLSRFIGDLAAIIVGAAN
jgi:D-alanyl-D-alanine carboxypeptidase